LQDDFVLFIADVDYSKIITIEPGKRSGKPTIRGTRMTVTDVLEYLAGGMTGAAREGCETVAGGRRPPESDPLGSAP
jgi:hypothetical protein